MIFKAASLAVAVALALVATVTTGTAATMDDGAKAPPAAERVEPEELGYDPDSATMDVHWRVEETDDSWRVSIGHGGLDDIPFLEEITRYAEGSPEAGQESSSSETRPESDDVGTMDHWSCTSTLVRPSFQVWGADDTVRAEFDHRCSSAQPGFSYRVEYQIGRSSYRGYLGFNSARFTNWTGNVRTALVYRALCNVGGGSYNYVTQTRLHISGEGASGWTRGPAQGLNCGPSGGNL